MSAMPATYKYPGMGLPLRYWHPSSRSFDASSGERVVYPMGAHMSSYSPPIYVREVSMMIVMEILTDKPDWHKKIFNDEIVAKWREEALAMPDSFFWHRVTSFKKRKPRYPKQDADDHEEDVRSHSELDPDVGQDVPKLKPVGFMSEKAFDWCVGELRAKARHFEETGIVVTLDLQASVAKSDTLVTPELHAELQAAFTRLKADQTASPDWHPNTDEKVQNLVHPSMYPLVYGRTRVLRQEVVGVSDAIDRWAGKGQILPKDKKKVPAMTRLSDYVDELPLNFWSASYQWLPSNLAFQDDGTVKFTSYINNLHPQKYPEIYKTIERLISTAIPMWEQVLVEVEFPHGSATDCPGHRAPRIPMKHEEWIPANMEECADMEVDPSLLRPEEYEWTNETEQKWRILRKPAHPEPGKQEEDKRSYKVPDESRLASIFKDSGLQVIVKMASIELTPDKPAFSAGSWHVEGQLNELICATALYYLDSENITTTSLAFRMQTDPEDAQEEIPYEQGEFEWHEQVYGTEVDTGPDSSCIQSYGSVETRQGRLLVFPNVFQHRVSSFRLSDPTKPGHRRFIALWLVDPNRRIISTANVPPQQRSWWSESVLGESAESRKAALAKFPPEVLSLVVRESKSTEDRKATKGDQPGDASIPSIAKTPRLPTELVQMMHTHSADDDPLMSEEEARKHRLDLMAERSWINSESDRLWSDATYNFCEH